MSIATVYALTGCEYCESLISLISNAGLTSQVSIVYDQGNGGCGSANPATVIGGVCHGYPSCDLNCQFAAIQAAASPAAKQSTTTTPTSTAKAAPTASATTTANTTPSWKTAKCSNTLTINWGAKNPKPTIAETPAGYEPPDVSLTPVLPLPPVMAAGITVALRNSKKMPPGRKVA